LLRRSADLITGKLKTLYTGIKQDVIWQTGLKTVKIILNLHRFTASQRYCAILTFVSALQSVAHLILKACRVIGPYEGAQQNLIL